MKLFLFCLVVLFALLLTARADRSNSPGRERHNFNREWKFRLGDSAGAESVLYDDAKWENVGLPQSFSIPYFAAGNAFYVGYGWYRKHFDVPAQWAGKRVFLDFEGAFQVAEIFLNGKKVGEHRGGYTGFEIEITDAAKAGTNLLAVRINNLWNPQLAPRAGEHQFSGGLYRNVWLVAVNPMHVAWYGVAVTTPELSAASGRVQVKTEVWNQSREEKECQLRTEVLDPAGAVVAQEITSRKIAPGQNFVFAQTTSAITSPKLWSPESPTLYSLVTTVEENGKPVDQVVTQFGFRWFQWTADRGFFLNGEHRYFKGANVHQDQAGWGDAVTDTAAARDVRMMKEAGFDFIRGSHYPHSPAFSRACDTIGMLYWAETVFWGTGGFKGDGYWNASAYPIRTEDEKGFEESVKQQLAEMIRIQRNHPSIVAWSMGNEAFFSASSVMPQVRRFLKELVDLTHELDPTRPAAIGGVQRGGIDKIGDIAGYNGDGARMAEYQNPGVPSVVSEYGSVISDRPGSYDSSKLSEMGQAPGADPAKPDSWRFPWRSGEAIWCGFDHGSIAGRKFGSMGLVDYYRLPKRSWFWYRNEYAKVPPPEWPKAGTPAKLKLEADKTILERVDGTDSAQIIVTVLDAAAKPVSNSVSITISIESGPGEFPTGPSITFTPDSDIAIREGKAAIDFRSYYAGRTLLRATAAGLEDATLTLESKNGPPFVPGKTPGPRVRPYRPVTEQSGAGTSSTFGGDNPTRVSSAAPGHPGASACDGNPATFWQAESPLPEAWWYVDLERIVDIQKFDVTFPEEARWRYRIEVSEDASRWNTAVDQMKSDSQSKQRSEKPSAHVIGRFVRLVFTEIPPGKRAALVEFTATGNLAE